MPIGNRTGRYDTVLDQLGARIVRGDVPPGTLLDPVQLEAEHGVSRSVIREVLRGLGTRGLVQATSGKGTFVNPRQEWTHLDPVVLGWQYQNRHDFEFLNQVSELRLTVEPAVARLAASRRDDWDIASLSDALAAMHNPAASAENHVDADVRFHQALLKSAHNELFESMSTIVEVALRARDDFVHNNVDLESELSREGVVETHEQVVEAIRNKRPRAAERAIRNLLEQSANDIEIARSRAQTVAVQNAAS